MPSYSATVEIAAPIDTVFEHVSDVARHGTWSADPLEITPAGDGAFTSRAQAKGKQIEAQLVMVESTPPERFVFDAVDLTGTWRHTFTLTRTEAGTRVTRTIEGSLSASQLLLYWLVLLPIKKPNARRALERLKQVVEGGGDAEQA